MARPEYSVTVRAVMVIVSLFVMITMLMAGMLYLEGKVFDGVRAYVRGEGLWAKAQKDAVLYLERYSDEHSASDMLGFDRSIQVIAGDRKARLALLQSPPDIAAATQGLLEGQNDALDVDVMIWFFRYFQNVSYMHDAIVIWVAGERKIDELRSVADDLKREHTSGHPQPQRLQALRERLRVLNTELLDLENQFSSALSNGARWVRTTVWQAGIALMALLVTLGVWYGRRIISAIAEAERELLISESRFTSLKESNTIGIISWRMNGQIDDANDSFLNMLGYSRTELAEGRLNWQKLTPEALQERDRQAVQELSEYGRCEPYEKLFLHKTGHTVPVYLGASLLRGDREHGIAFIVDNTEKKRAEEIIRQQANYDMLTELPNRRMVDDRLGQQLLAARRNGKQVALMFIDLDDFKEVNDTLGHAMGDALLKEVARRMQNCVRESDTVGRLGGDEFIVIVGQLDDVTIVERIALNIMKHISEPYYLGSKVAYISASMGISLFPGDSEDIATLLRNADHAMYAAKRAGKNNFRFYSSMHD